MNNTVAWPDPARREAFEHWLAGIAGLHAIQPETMTLASADASFRRYLRVSILGGGSLIIMDAPPPLENVRPFVQVAGLIAAAGLNVPQVLACDADHGFLLLSDLGHRLFVDELRAGNRVEMLMRDALGALVQFQAGVRAESLPPYDEILLRRELALFPEWCVLREFGITWTEAQHKTWQGVCQHLVDSALAQPVVAVHRDYMARNLMLGDPNPGILDFQDAVRGPITYDLASLLRDAFLTWDEAQELDWAVRWWEQARRAGLPLSETMSQDFGEFWRALEWMGLQRHLKVLGIFCRLKHRDGKPRYAEDLPRFFAYANKVALRYRPLKPLVQLLEPLSGQRIEAGFTF
jgi:aminoglycoside/choline kinase family phosphotransferase